jgi:hypothetical protein
VRCDRAKTCSGRCSIASPRPSSCKDLRVFSLRKSGGVARSEFFEGQACEIHEPRPCDRRVRRGAKLNFRVRQSRKCPVAAFWQDKKDALHMSFTDTAS